jgi:hypothetical protein
MKKIALAGLLLALLPTAVFAAHVKPMHKMAVVKSAPTLYKCSKCGMTYSATAAKKDHYKDPMDGGTLVPVKTAKK